MQTAVIVLADADLEKKRRSKIYNICETIPTWSDFMKL
jgi:hypothetical protein